MPSNFPIKYKDKPTPEQLALYKKKVEFFLQYLNVEIEIYLCLTAMLVESRTNGALTDRANLWIDKIIIKTPEIKFETRLPYESGIDENSLGDERVYYDSHYFQDEIYLNLGKNPQTPLPNNDPYWKLWGLHPKLGNLPNWSAE